MSLNFDNCMTSAHCAKVYYVLCAGEFEFQKQEKVELIYQENITDRHDQCFSGSTVRVKYQGQDHPIIAAWFGR